MARSLRVRPLTACFDSGALATIDGKSVTIYADIMNEADPLGITAEKGGS